jgi:peptidoglycan/LPS O-acetylase OafA/YrhL
VGTKESVSTLLFAYLDTMTFLNSTLIFNSLYTSNVGNMGMNFPSWSISAELIIYVFFGCTLLFSFQQKWNRDLILFFVLIAAIGFSLNKGMYSFADDFGYIRGMISFILGYFVWNFTKNKTKWTTNLSLFVLPLIIAALYFLHQQTGYLYQMMALAIVPLLFAFSILLIVQSDGILTSILNLRPLIFLGKISYSIYLNQIIVITIIPHFLFQIFELNPTGTIQIIVLLCSLVVLIIYSFLTNQLIETQFGKWLKARFVPS